MCGKQYSTTGTRGRSRAPSNRANRPETLRGKGENGFETLWRILLQRLVSVEDFS